MSADDDRTPEPTAESAPAAEPMHPVVRWLARLAVAATAFLYLAVLLGVCAGGWALVELARGGRGG